MKSGDDLQGELNAIETGAGNALQRFFNRTPFLAGRHLHPQVQGTMDVSLNWPLQPAFHNFDFTAVNGTNMVTIAQPGPAEHMVIQYCFANTNTLGANKQFILTLEPLPGNPAVNTLSIFAMGLVNRHNCSPISGSYTEDQTALGFQDVNVVGVRPIYLTNPFSLILFYIGGVAGDLVRIRTMDYTFPATQPLSTLIQF